MRAIAIGIALVAIACGPSASTPPEPHPSAVHVEPVPPPAEPEEAPAEPAPPPTFSDAELDAMDRAGLESACFAGSTGACDRLGH
ncbi:hypothetical protein [Sandaracinus amylolyticus]|uniref:hypothetical protein n=1 Tax=Sandaracinus amylolyticus TaxID=927083 RepID=UPI001F2F66B5|nr:hypothetical protein [Sandaracinus amylolyticus]UJR84660.1 Hypothetical protein I5071_67390 [Sandaracinus amylolyticus]